MTRKEAVVEFHQALLAAISASPTVQKAVSGLRTLGIVIEQIQVDVVASLAAEEPEPAAAQSDADFLRNLRIVPSIDPTPEGSIS